MCNKSPYKVTPRKVAAVSNLHVLYPYGNPYGNPYGTPKCSTGKQRKNKGQPSLNARCSVSLERVRIHTAEKNDSGVVIPSCSHSVLNLALV